MFHSIRFCVVGVVVWKAFTKSLWMSGTQRIDLLLLRFTSNLLLPNESFLCGFYLELFCRTSSYWKDFSRVCTNVFVLFVWMLFYNSEEAEKSMADVGVRCWHYLMLEISSTWWTQTACSVERLNTASACASTPAQQRFTKVSSTFFFLFVSSRTSSHRIVKSNPTTKRPTSKHQTSTSQLVSQ